MGVDQVFRVHFRAHFSESNPFDSHFSYVWCLRDPERLALRRKIVEEIIQYDPVETWDNPEAIKKMNRRMRRKYSWPWRLFPRWTRS